MKKIQLFLALTSGVLLIGSLLLQYKMGIYISMGGLCLSLLIKQFRLQKYTYMLGHPERHSDKGYGMLNHPLDLAETYELDENIKRDVGTK